MALISCPECGCEIPKGAKSCPECGWPVEDEHKSSSGQDIGFVFASKKTRKNSILLIVTAVVLIAVILIVGLSMVARSSKKQATTTKKESADSTNVEKEAEEKEDPDSCKVIIDGDKMKLPCTLSDLIDEGFSVCGSFNNGDTQDFALISKDEAKDFNTLSSKYYHFYVHKDKYYELYMDKDRVVGTTIWKTNGSSEIAGLSLTLTLGELKEKLGPNYYIVYHTYVWPHTEFGVIEAAMIDGVIDSISLNKQYDSMSSASGIVYSFITFDTAPLEERIEAYGELDHDELVILDRFLQKNMEAFRSHDIEKIKELFMAPSTKNDKEWESLEEHFWGDDENSHDIISAYHFTVHANGGNDDYDLSGEWIGMRPETRELEFFSDNVHYYYDSNEPDRWSINYIVYYD